MDGKYCSFKECKKFKACPKALTRNQIESYLHRLSEEGHTNATIDFFDFPPSCFESKVRKDGFVQPLLEFD